MIWGRSFPFFSSMHSFHQRIQVVWGSVKVVVISMISIRDAHSYHFSRVLGRVHLQVRKFDNPTQNEYLWINDYYLFHDSDSDSWFALLHREYHNRMYSLTASVFRFFILYDHQFFHNSVFLCLSSIRNEVLPMFQSMLRDTSRTEAIEGIAIATTLFSTLNLVERLGMRASNRN